MTIEGFKTLARQLNAKRKYVSFFDTPLKSLQRRRIHTIGELIHGCYFVTSEQIGGSPRKYTIRKADIKTGCVTTVKGFQYYATPKAVANYLKTLG